MTDKPVAWAVHWQCLQSRKPVLVHADEKPSEFWRPMPRCVALYESPQPTLTAKEREAIEFFDAIHNEGYGLFAKHTATLRKLLERLK